MLPHYSLQTAADFNPLLAASGEARVVLLGEALHGTLEYYTRRMALSKRLIEAHGFQFIAVEGDWPASFKVNAAIKRTHCPTAPASTPRLLCTRGVCDFIYQLIFDVLSTPLARQNDC